MSPWYIHLLQNGKVLTDKDGKVLVPLNSEYSVRVRNKSRSRCSVDLFVDGKTAVKNVAINPDSFVDIPGFYDENTKEVRCFLLVSSDNPKVDQPGDSQNGLVEVKIYKEVEFNFIPSTFPYNIPNTNMFWCPVCGWSNTAHSHQTICPIQPYYPYTPQIICYSPFENSAANTLINDVASIPGTIYSNNPQTSTSFSVDTNTPTSMSLRLIGVKSLVLKCSCGYKRKNENFCPNCGNQFVKK